MNTLFDRIAKISRNCFILLYFALYINVIYYCNLIMNSKRRLILTELSNKIEYVYFIVFVLVRTKIGKVLLYVSIFIAFWWFILYWLPNIARKSIDSRSPTVKEKIDTIYKIQPMMRMRYNNK